jgi:hypothetical protein
MRSSVARLALAACLAGFTVGCSAGRPADGTVHGHLYGVGGPPPGSPRSWSGTVTVTGSGIHRDVQAGPPGAFSITLPAGKYTITGHSPSYQGDTGLCRALGIARVRSGQRTTANVLCQLR